MQKAINEHIKERVKLISNKVNWQNLSTLDCITFDIVKDR